MIELLGLSVTNEKLTKEVFAALKDNDVVKLNRAIGLGASINYLNADNRNPLILAVRNKILECFN